jgi:thymidine kinase
LLNLDWAEADYQFFAISKVRNMNQGIYEELVTKLISFKINELDKETFQIKKSSIDKAEAAQILSQHIGKTIHTLNLIKGEDILETQIEIANKIILFLKKN